MKRLRSTLFAATLLVILSAACGSQPASTANLNGTLGSAGSTAAAASPTPDPGLDGTTLLGGLQAVTSAHPPMQAGSLDRYFDGALLDAVPNDGPFVMGSGVPGNPQYQVTVSKFWIYSTEVSNQMYAWCVSLGKCKPPDG